MIHELLVFHICQFRQSIRLKPERQTYIDFLRFTQTITHNIRTRKLTSTLKFTQSIGLQTSIKYLDVRHTLAFTQSLGRNPIYQDVRHALFLRHSVQQPKWEQVTSVLNLDQAVIGHSAKAVKSNLKFNQTVVGNVVRAITIEHNLNLVNGVSAWLSDPNFNYLNPVFTIIEKVRFTYGGEVIYLRKPDFDDTYKYDFTRINQRSRGGDLIIGRDAIWPETKTFTITFTYLSQAEIDRMLSFMKLSLGKRCRYLNYDNVEWEGFITNPQTEARQIGRSNMSMSIEFEGEPL
jgi:hypothetical protein